MQRLLFDLGYAARLLRKTPGLVLLAISTLALGIGANTAIFTVIESVLLHPLPYAASNRLLSIGPGGKPGFNATSWLNYRDLRDQSRQLQAVAGYAEDVGVMQDKDSSQSVLAPRITPNVTSVLGVQPLLGRTFTEAEGQTGGPAAVLLSEGLWRQNFRGDPQILGKPVTISGKPYTVVGVMPGWFRFPEQMGADLSKGVWLPLQPTGEMLHDRGYHFFNMIGTLQPGASRTQAQQELDSIAAHIPRSSGEEAVTLKATPYQEVLTGPVGPALYGLLAALALVLVIACANVSNLLLARCLGRQQEFAVRAALGAGRARLIQQLAAEGLLLSLCGCAVGALLAELAMIAGRKLPQDTLPRGEFIAIHWSVLLVLAAIALVTTFLSSLLPAVLVARSHPRAALQAGSRGVGSRSVSGKLTGSLVAGEVALSTLLLVGTGLLFHTLWNLQQSKLGFETARITTFSAMPANSAGFTGLAVSEATKDAPPSIATLTYLPALERIRQAPGVERAAAVTSPPLSGMDVGTSFSIAGQAADPSHKPEARVSAVSGDYAATMGTPLVRGRMIDDRDSASGQFVVVINESLAKKYFAGQDPLQKQLTLGGKDTGMVKPYTIVGILADQVDSNVGSAANPLLILGLQQVPTTSLFYQALLETVMNFVVKTRGEVPIAGEMRSVFHETAPGFALDNFQTMQQVIDSNTFSHQLGLYLVGSFAGLAVVMVVAGLYGVLSQLVSYRRREIGVRMALGASRSGVAQLVLREGGILIGIGLGAGLLLALGGARFVQGFLYHVRPVDLLTYAGVILVLLPIGLLAALLPARAATRIEPMEALRE